MSKPTRLTQSGHRPVKNISSRLGPARARGSDLALAQRDRDPEDARTPPMMLCRWSARFQDGVGGAARQGKSCERRIRGAQSRKHGRTDDVDVWNIMKPAVR